MVMFVAILGDLQGCGIIKMFDCFDKVVIVGADFSQSAKTTLSSQFHAFNAVNDWQNLHVDICLRPYIDSLSLLQG